MTDAHLDNPVSLRSASGSSWSSSELSSSSKQSFNDNDDKTTEKTQASHLEIELDKFMAILTAKESPDAVIKTIGNAKDFEISRN